MPNVRFNLKPGGDPKLIMLVFRVYGNKFQYSTSQKIGEKYWDKSKCRARQLATYPLYKELNALLNLLDNTTQNAYRKFINDHSGDLIKPTFVELKSDLKKALDKALMKDIAEF